MNVGGKKIVNTINSMGISITQLVFMVFFLFQVGLFFYLMNYHHFFTSSVYELSKYTSNNIKVNEPPITMTNIEKQEIEPTRKEPDNDSMYEYITFPVQVKGMKSALTLHHSASVLSKLLGTVIDTDFPDLKYRAKEEIQEKLPRIFEELPKSGFMQELKNPCWHAEEGGLHCLPYAYILGQPKCGTSDLFERLKSHPQIVMPDWKEVRWFTRGEFSKHALLYEDGMGIEKKGGGALIGPGTSIFSFTRSFAPLTRRLSNELRKNRVEGRHRDGAALSVNSELITIDGGPHTLWWPTQSPDGAFLPADIPPPQLLREIQPEAKFLVTLSDPVKRMYSDYYFLKDDLKPLRPKDPNNKSAQEFHERAKEQVETFNLCVEKYVQELKHQLEDKSQSRGKVTSKLEKIGFGKLSELDLPHHYKEIFPVWFRAAQMCAHDRHTFAVGGFGRLSIGLYVLFLEKWLEHFELDQFLLVRLEDYKIDERAYLQRIFSFLELREDIITNEDWRALLVKKHFNENHSVQREPILAETETLLRDFYRPYNQLLALVMKDADPVRANEFLWEGAYSMNGVQVSLRAVQLAEHREMKRGEIRQRESEHQVEDVDSGDSHGHRHSREQMNRHDPRRHEDLAQHEEEQRQRFVDAEEELELERGHKEDLFKEGEKTLRRADRLRRRYEEQQKQALQDQLNFVPRSLDIAGLPMPTPEEEEKHVKYLTESEIEQLRDKQAAAKALCVATFSLNLAQVKYFLYDLGMPAQQLKYKGDGDRNALHCLGLLYTMGEAHPYSHIFAELKGAETWLTPHIKPALEKKTPSVMSRDIVDRLAEDMVKIAQWLHRAGIDVNGEDVAGNTPLHLAAIGGELELVRFLARDARANVNKVSRDRGRTPLHFAAGLGHTEVCAVLIAAGADWNIRDVFGVSAKDIIVNPGPVPKNDALVFLNITQRPTRQIPRVIHPELLQNDSKIGWIGTGGWDTMRLRGFEQDMDCSCVDQYFHDEITAEEIFTNYMAHNAPVLIRGLLDGWKVVEEYQQDNLSSKHGKLGVQVSDIPYARKFGGSGVLDMTLADYIEEMKAHKIVGGNHPWYVFRGHQVPEGSEGPDSLVKYDTCPIPTLLRDAFEKASPRGILKLMRQRNNPNSISEPEETHAKYSDKTSDRENFVNAQWALGGEGTGAPIHFHNTAWAALIYGAKKWFIYPPHNMIMSNKQILDFYESDRLEYLKRGIEPVTCVQTAGDVMIIPESWGHGVLNIQETVAIATEFKHSLWRIHPNTGIFMNLKDTFNNRKESKKERRSQDSVENGAADLADQAEREGKLEKERAALRARRGQQQ